MSSEQVIGLVTVAFSPGDTLASLLDSVPTATERRVVVVVSDNGSPDGSVELAGRRPGVVVVRNASNLGYGAAINAGVAALPSEADPVLIVNPDVELGSGAVDALLRGLDRHPDAGAVGPLISTEAGIVYPSARRLPSIGAGVGHAALGWCWPNNPWTRQYRQDHDAPQERVAGWLSGSCLLVRRRAFAAVGGFDPGFFMYFEDVDLGRRLGRIGWSSYYIPDAMVLHHGGHTTRRHRSEMVRAHHQSAYRYLAERYDAAWQAPLRWALRAGLAARTAMAVRSERVAAGADLPDRRAQQQPVDQGQ